MGFIGKIPAEKNPETPFLIVATLIKVKVKQSLYTPRRRLGGEEV